MLEIIVSSVRPFELMLGKILGIASVALVQFLIWVALILALGTAALHLLTPDALIPERGRTRGCAANGRRYACGDPAGNPTAVSC